MQIVLRTLGMPDQTNPIRYYKLAEKFDIYQHAKNQLHSLLLLEILQKYYIRLAILSTLVMPGYTHQI